MKAGFLMAGKNSLNRQAMYWYTNQEGCAFTLMKELI